MRTFRTLLTLLLVVGTSLAVGYGLRARSEQAGARSGGQSPQASARVLPEDIDPVSGNRLPLVKREELDDFGKKLAAKWEAEEGGKLEEIRGPESIRLHSPHVADYMHEGNRWLRNQSGLEPKMVELTILVAARAMNNQYEWSAHEPAGLRAGLDPATIEIVKHRRPLTGVGEKEAFIIQLGREVYGDYQVGSDTFARGLKLFGRQGLVNIASLMGHYTATAILLTAFDQQLRPGQTPLLPLP